MKLASIKEVSRFLKVKESTLYSWVRNGTIPSYKLNGLIRFDMAELEEWIKESRLVSCNVRMPKGNAKNIDINSAVKKAIADVTGKGYNPSKRENQAKIKVSGRRF